MIAYDTNILIYALEGSSEWASKAQALVLRGEQEGAVLSVLAWQELMTGLALRTTDSEEELAHALRDLSATIFEPVTKAICERAVELTEVYCKKLFGYDAIHIATALEHGADAFFTNDQQLLTLKINGLELSHL